MTTTSRPTLSFWQIWNMSFGFLGIQFGFALQNANVSRIFQTLGASIDDIPILWIAGPITGLLVQPIIGYMSDRTWGRFGRRRPYFLAGAILAALALLVMPNSPWLWIAAGTLWIMDAAFNIAMEPMRAFVGDMLPEKQRTTGFVMQSFFIGVGAVIASMLPWIFTNWFGIANEAPAGEIPDSVRYAFYWGGFVLLAAILWTVFTTKEYPPETLNSFEQSEDATAHSEHTALRSPSHYFRDAIIWLVVGLGLVAAVFYFTLDKQLYILGFGGAVFGVMLIAMGALTSKQVTASGFYQIFNDLFHMPKTMKQLAVVQFFSWFALFAMWIYTTSAVTSNHYGTQDPTSALFNEGANWVGVLFASYNGFAALAAFLIPVIANATSRKMAHSICLIAGGAGLASFAIIDDPQWLLLSMVGVGIAWASILSMPYAILSCSLPNHKMGIYMGIFNFFIVLPQLLAATLIGLVVRELFAGEAIYALVLGGTSLVIAAIATLFVHDQGAQA